MVLLSKSLQTLLYNPCFGWFDIRDITQRKIFIKVRLTILINETFKDCLTNVS